MTFGRLVEPLRSGSRRPVALGVVLLLGASAGCIATASLVMPDDYSWLRNAISESAAQGVRFAWVARLGFVLFGGAVLWLAASLRSDWACGTYVMQTAFGLFMMGAAAFSHKPWRAGAPFDPIEDLLHSIAATGMGFAFSIGVAVRFVQRRKLETFKKTLDLLALAAATALPPLGVLWPSMAGLLQRTLFLLAYSWFAHEALTGREPHRVDGRMTS